ncbi:mitochondrial genome maintenance exonuclease 1-like, partial [Glandiceps talaboti]
PLQKDAGFVLENWKSVSMDVRKGERFPSVTRILQDTMPLNNLLMLLKWKRKMIQELGEEGFLKLNEETLQEGSALHRCIQMYFTGTPLNEIEVGEGNQGHWKSLSTVLPQITDVKATEKHIKHPVLQYGGYLDCLATYKGKLCVIDWKTSKTPKPTLARCFDSPLQTAAYTGAVNFEDSLGLEVENTLLVISYKSGQKAHVHFMPKDTSQFYWEKWLKRLYFYKEMRKRERAARDASDTDTY